MEEFDFKTKEEALIELIRLTNEFFDCPTPSEFATLNRVERVEALNKIRPLKEKIERFSIYIKEKWGGN